LKTIIFLPSNQRSGTCDKKKITYPRYVALRLATILSLVKR
jgi:hypothetical protein